MLQAVAEEYENAVIVTADDHMPEEWSQMIADLGSTIATIMPFVGHRQAHLYSNEDAWERAPIT
jgi:hypothetical protein